MKKVVRIILLLLILGAGGGFYYWKYNPEQNQPSNSITLYGNVDLRTVQLSFNEQEIVKEILVDEGDIVEKGQLLATLRDTKLMAQLQEAEAMVSAQEEAVRLLVAGSRPQEISKLEAQLEAAQVRVSNSERILKRQKVTSGRGASTIQDLDNAKADLDIAKAELNVVRESLTLAEEGFRSEQIAEGKALLKARQAQVTLLQERLYDTALYAPAPGIIESRIMEPGEVAASGRTAFSLAIMAPKWVRAYLPEPDLGFVAHGMEAKVISDSFPQDSFSGKVGFISAAAEFTPKFVQTTELRTQLVYETRIWVEDPENRLRLGMPVTVVIKKPGTTDADNGVPQDMPESKDNQG